MTKSTGVRQSTEDVWYAGDGKLFLSEEDRREYERAAGRQTLTAQ